VAKKKKKYSGPRSSALRAKSKEGGGGKNPIQVRSQAEFERYLEGPEPVIIDFWAPWCGPCKSFGPTFEKVGKVFEGKVRFLKVNTEDQPAIAQSFSIRSIPTCLAMVGDEVADSHLGVMSEPALFKMAQRLDDKVKGVGLGDKVKRFFGRNKGDAEGAEDEGSEG